MGYRKALASAFTTLAAAALVLLAATVGVAGAATAAVQAPSPLASPSRLAAPTAAGTKVRFSVGLKMHNRAGAIALEREVSEPGNPRYRHYLTPAQFELRFSPSRLLVNLVSDWLRSQGITVLGVTPDSLAIEAQASASVVSRAFGTSLGEYRRGNAEIRLASSALSAPSAVASLISGIVGVNEQFASHDSLTGAEPAEGTAAPSARSSAKPAIAHGGQIPPPAGFANAPPCSDYYGEKRVVGDTAYGDGFPALTWAPCGYTPEQLQGAYNLTGAIGAGINGTGVTVAIVDAYAASTLLEDAQKYTEVNQKNAILKAPQIEEKVAPKFSEEELCEAPGWSGEQTLDVESVHAMAPGAKILYMGAESCLNPALFGAVREVVDNKLAQIVTDSWGDNGGDLFDIGKEREVFDELLVMAGVTGVGVQFSSGDEGSNFTDLGMNVPDYPTDSPYAISVGGTSLQVSKQNTRIGETGWSTSRSYLCSGLLEEFGLPGCEKFQRGRWDPAAPGAYDYGGGGGTSFVYPAPWWQTLGEVPASLLARNAPVTHEANRVDPDISMDADPSTGMKIGETQEFANGVRYGEYRLGGTSLASPLFAGVMADADQAAGPPALGFVNPLLYELAAESSSPFLTSGSIYDPVAAGKQAIARNDYLAPEAEELVYTTARVLGYEGPEEYCSGTEECEEQNVELHATPGFDSMTGVGSPGPEFLRFAATLKP